MDTSNAARMLTLGEVAAELGVHRATLHNYVHRGLLVPDAYGNEFADGRTGRRLFKQETIDDFISRCAKSDFTGEYLYSSGEASKMVGLSLSGFKYYVQIGLVQPDVVLPAYSNGKPGEKRFKKSTILTFKEVIKERRRDRHA